MAVFRHASQGVTVRNFWLCKPRNSSPLLAKNPQILILSDYNNGVPSRTIMIAERK